MMRRVYRAAAAGCAEVVSRVPSLERRFVQMGAWAWSRPFAGRVFRSIADRVATRLRRRGAVFRTLVVSEVPLILDVTEFTTKTLYFGRAAYEPRTTERLTRVLAAGSVFVDVGANHGYYTLLAAALVGPTGRVVAFEPNPVVFEQLQQHVRLNGFETRVATIQAALADEPGDEVPLFVSQSADNSGLSSLAPAAALIDRGLLSLDHRVSVRVDTFDRWFQGSGLARIDLVKIDVEGAEDRVLAGMAASLASTAIAAMVCETVWDGPAHRVLCNAGFVPSRLDALDGNCNIFYSREARGAS